MAFTRYVAIGDSTTEGLEDLYPDGRGYRGWADRLASMIAATQAPPATGQVPRGSGGASPRVPFPRVPFAYANLAVRGKLARQVREEQLESALALEPDLATVVAGLNDALRPRCDLDLVAGHLDAMVGALAATGATVATMTFPDPAPVNPLARHARPRLFALNRRLRDIGARHGALVVDFERDGVADRRLWHSDRLHAGPLGHARIAGGFAEALGVAGSSSAWTEPLPPPERVPRHRAVGAHALWTGRHLTPWLVRRLRGVSSGDGRLPKRPVLEPFAPE